MKRIFLITALLALLATTGRADDAVAMRRPVDVDHPMFLVHIDTWNHPDPEKIISLIPSDVLPWCVFNVSLSVSHNESTGVWNLARNGIETARSWVRVCAEHGVWCTVQPSSGGFSHFPDLQMDVYEEFFQDYPNFIGFNYCEQFWGFNDQFSVTVPTRLAHFAKLMELSVKYGGYLIVSWCGGIWHHDTNPVAMMKRNSDLLQICKAHPDNLIMCFKYTSAASWYNNESVCLGTFISGLTNNYGVRYDECGWALADGEKYPTAVGIGPVMENIQLTGMTVFDGPELIWRQCFTENGTATTSDGYTSRQWRKFSQYENIWVDLWRKMIDGTLRVATRKEVMQKTQLVLVQDVNSGNAKQMYASPDNLYDGLYRQDGEGTFDQNTHFFKKTGRYGAIPIVVGLYDTDATVIPVRIRQSQYASRWSTTAAKVAELNKYAPEEYTGTLYAGRMKNAWVTYYPFAYGETAWANIPFKYNTCDSMRLDYSEYSAGLIHEYKDHVDFYLNNYRVDSTELKTDRIRIYGATSEPTLTWSDREQHQKSSVSSTWADGVFTIEVSHCGAVDVNVSCSGKRAVEKMAEEDLTRVALEAPAGPPTYYGPVQHEAECFDYKNVQQVVKSPFNGCAEGHYGQGYLVMGTNTSAIVKDSVRVPAAGKYRISVRYQSPQADAEHIMMQVNTTVLRRGLHFVMPQTADGEWGTASTETELKEGANVIYLRVSTTYGKTIVPLNIDNIVVEPVENIEGIEPVTGNSLSANLNSQTITDLQGRRVNGPLQHDIYIINGKKYFIK